MNQHPVPPQLLSEKIPNFNWSVPESVFNSETYKIYSRADILTAAEIGYTFAHSQLTARIRAYEDILRNLGVLTQPKPTFRLLTWLRTFFS